MREIRKSVQIGMGTRAANLEPKSANAERRTIDLIWTKGARVRRYDWRRDIEYWEQLSLEPQHVRLERLNGGAPLLDSHARWSLENVIGVVEEASVDGTAGAATVRFSEREEVEPIWRDVQAGIIRQVSHGYLVHQYRDVTGPDDEIPVWEAIDWEPMELSMVPIGADPAAQTRAERERQGPFEATLISRAESAQQEEETMNEETRNAILERVRAADLEDSFAESLIERGLDDLKEVDAAVAKEVERKRSAAPPPTAEPTPAAPARQETRTDAGLTEAEVDARVEARMEAERIRRSGIRSAVSLGFRNWDGASAFAEELCERRVTENGRDRVITVDEATRAVLERRADLDAAEPQVRNGVSFPIGGLDDVATRRDAISAALLHRYDRRHFELTDPAREYRGLTLLEVAREVVERSGTATRGLSRNAIAERAFHSVSDFPAILADVANKSLRRAYDAQPRTFLAWTSSVTATDFKELNRTQLGDAPDLLEVGDGGEITRGTISDARERYALATYARVVGITRRTIINDDLDSLTRIPAMFGIAAARMESNVIYAILTGNPAMHDGDALFHANHGNLAGAGAAIDVATLGAGRAAMRRQTGLDGQRINVSAQYLLVPAALETVADQFVADNIPVVANQPSQANPFQGRLTPVAEPRLDDDSATRWYLVADPSTIDTIEYAFLEGEEGVQIETRVGFDVDGMEIKAREDFGAAAIDWRGLYRNDGA